MTADNGVEPMTLGRILSAAGASRNVVALRSNLTGIGWNSATGEPELRAN